jgi:hypothetical protein
VKEKGLKRRALVSSRDDIILNAEENRDLSALVKKAVLNERATIRATERKIKSPLTPSEATLILKELVARKENVLRTEFLRTLSR